MEATKECIICLTSSPDVYRACRHCKMSAHTKCLKGWCEEEEKSGQVTSNEGSRCLVCRTHRWMSNVAISRLLLSKNGISPMAYEAVHKHLSRYILLWCFPTVMFINYFLLPSFYQNRLSHLFKWVFSFCSSGIICLQSIQQKAYNFLLLRETKMSLRQLKMQILIYHIAISVAFLAHEWIGVSIAEFSGVKLGVETNMIFFLMVTACAHSLSKSSDSE